MKLFICKKKILIPFKILSLCEKNSFCTKKICFCKKNFILQKKSHSGKKILSVKNISFCKKSHSLKNKFYFQFSFATNEQV